MTAPTSPSPPEPGPEPDPEAHGADEAGEESFPASDPPASWSGPDEPPPNHAR